MKGRWEGKEEKEEKEQSTKVTLSNLGCWSEVHISTELKLQRKKPVEEASALFRAKC